MAKAEATVEELVSKIERGELRLPEMQLCTSPVQTFLDLSAAGERGKEAAEHLRSKLLRWTR